MDTTAINTSAPNFGVFAELSNYGPIGLIVLALGYVAWIFIQRHLAEKDRLQQEAKPKRKTRKNK
jgi:hypothetical protein